MEKMVRCGRFGFELSEELISYVTEKLAMLEEKTNIEGFVSDRLDIMMAAFESAEVQDLIEKNKVYVNVPEPFLSFFNVTPEKRWKADIPFSVAVGAIDREISSLYNEYGVTEG